MPISAQTSLSLACQILRNESRATASEVAPFFDLAQASAQLTIETIQSRREGKAVNYTKIKMADSNDFHMHCRYTKRPLLSKLNKIDNAINDDVSEAKAFLDDYQSAQIKLNRYADARVKRATDTMIQHATAYHQKRRCHSIQQAMIVFYE